MSAPPAVQIREANAHLAALHGRVAELERRLGAAERTGGLRAPAGRAWERARPAPSWADRPTSLGWAGQWGSPAVRPAWRPRVKKDGREMRTGPNNRFAAFAGAVPALCAGPRSFCEPHFPGGIGIEPREITALQQKLLSSEETVQKLLNVIQKKDDLIVQLKHRSHLLTKICRNRPILDSLLSYMAEGEQLSTFPGTQSDSSSPVHDEFQESNCITNQISKNKDFSLSEDDLEDQELDTSQFGTTV
nr:uncharacterized protein LOC116821019 [Chelonoidis abingdonii]